MTCHLNLYRMRKYSERSNSTRGPEARLLRRLTRQRPRPGAEDTRHSSAMADGARRLRGAPDVALEVAAEHRKSRRSRGRGWEPKGAGRGPGRPGGQARGRCGQGAVPGRAYVTPGARGS